MAIVAENSATIREPDEIGGLAEFWNRPDRAGALSKLDGWAGCIGPGAKDAAVAGQRFEDFMAAGAFEESDAGIHGHVMYRSMIAERTLDDGLQTNLAGTLAGMAIGGHGNCPIHDYSDRSESDRLAPPYPPFFRFS